MTIRPYRVLLTGSRTGIPAEIVQLHLGRTLAWAESYNASMVLVHGMCPDGVDADGDAWAVRMQSAGRPVSVERHPAQSHPTEDFGPWPGAGPKRNAFMVSLGAHLCLALIAPCTKRGCRRPGRHGSHGASGCADLAEAAGITVRRLR